MNLGNSVIVNLCVARLLIDDKKITPIKILQSTSAGFLKLRKRAANQIRLKNTDRDTTFIRSGEF